MSSLSLFSSFPQLQTKHSPSIQAQQSPNQRSHSMTPSQEDFIYQLRQQVHRLQQQEDEMQLKFQECVDLIEAQINRNQRTNQRLAAQVAKLNSEVAESKQDLFIIDEFIKANSRRTARSPLVRRQEREGEPRKSSRDLESRSNQKSPKFRRPTSGLFKSKISVKS